LASVLRRLLPLGLLLSACAHQTTSPFREIDVEIGKELANGIPSIAVAVAKNGAIVHETAFGGATVDTPFPLASVTKPLVATGIMVLARDGKIRLDQPAHLYAGGWIPNTAQYTVRQLLNHTSGLPTYATIRWAGEPSPPHDLREMVRRYGFAAHPPGVVSEYSNIGYGLLGHIIEVQSGMSLEAFLRARVFGPLAMNHTTFVENANVARKHDASGKPLPATVNDTPGAGNAYASVHDLVRFGMFHVSSQRSRVLEPIARTAMQVYVEPGAIYPYYNSSHYGFGWYFRQTEKGVRVVWHEGGMPGASTILVLLPDLDIVAAVLINANDRNDVAQSIVNRLIAAVDPSIGPLTFDPTEGFTRFDAQPAFLGRWEGTLTIDDKPLNVAMAFESGGTVKVTLPGREATFRALVNGDLMLGTFAATLPANDVAQNAEGYVLVRLVRRGDQLNGTFVAYASPEGLRHLYPFAVTLRKAS
jgi:CubicO group peptidase (beta-lactamase class C family)